MSDERQEKGFWARVKDGFAYGLGGGFGWTLGSELASFLIRWVKRIVIAVVLGGGWGAATMIWPESPFDMKKPGVMQPTKAGAHSQHQYQGAGK